MLLAGNASTAHGKNAGRVRSVAGRMLRADAASCRFSSYRTLPVGVVESSGDSQHYAEYVLLMPRDT